MNETEQLAWKRRMDQRHATSEGMYQAERYRRERLEQKLDRRKKIILELDEEMDRLRAIIERAPHGRTCANDDTESRYPCTCWKADAL